MLLQKFIKKLVPVKKYKKLWSFLLKETQLRLLVFLLKASNERKLMLKKLPFKRKPVLIYKLLQLSYLAFNF